MNANFIGYVVSYIVVTGFLLLFVTWLLLLLMKFSILFCLCCLTELPVACLICDSGYINYNGNILPSAVTVQVALISGLVLASMLTTAGLPV